MNQRPLRPCKKISCPNLIRDMSGYCEEHKYVAEEIKSKRNQYYNKYKREEKYTRFYNSKAWKQVRKYILTLYYGIDIYDYYTNNNDEIVLATTVHHIEELKDNWDRRLDVNNLFPLNESNHNTIHNLYDKDKEGTQELLKEMLGRFKKEFNIPPSM